VTLRQLLAHKAVKNICVGRCVNHDDWQDTDDGVHCYREQAHAHVKGCDHPGWICVRNPRHVLSGSSRHVSGLLLHELAHLISQSGHNETWRQTMRGLGQTIPKQYQRRARDIR
jgi:hypothetical protein